MNWRFIVCGLAALTIGNAESVNGNSRNASSQGTVWLNNYETARKIARESGKPLFVVFRCEH